MTVENFSRPRKPSVRSQHSDTPLSRHLAGSRLQTHSSHDQLADGNQLYPNHNVASSPWSRARGLSTSSSQSTSTFSSSIQPRPSNDHLGATSRTPSLRRPNPTSTNTPRQHATHANIIAPKPTREAPPWVAAGEELRSSFRSQLTASTAHGTLFTASGTERSSVLTKTSSIAEHSIINGYARTSWRTNSIADDGLSLEDVMGMYERGFDDSDIESVRRSMRFTGGDDDSHSLDFPPGGMTVEVSRPPSSRSNASAMGAKMLEAMNDQLPMPGALAVPVSDQSARGQSRNSVRKSLLPSSLPKDMGLGFGEYMARRDRTDVQDLGKHDSAKMLDADEDTTAQPPLASQQTQPIAERNPTSTFDGQGEQPPSRAATPAQMAYYPPEPPEEPGSRDRYGFRKANANVTREEYDAWDASYSEYLARRRKKWIAYLKDNSLMTDRPNRFPARNAKTKRFIRKGIPPEWRGAAWFYYAGGPAILGKHRGVYDDLLRRAALDPEGPGKLADRATEVKPLVVEDIEKDLHRTFPDNIKFKPPRATPEPHEASDSPQPTKPLPEPQIISSLRRVLHAFALYNPRIGYCQSLNFLAGLLLLFVETEEQAFWLLNVITRVYLPGTHEMSLEGSKVDLGVLMVALKDSLPNVWKQIGGDELEGTPTKRFRGRRGKDGGNKASGPGANDPNRLPAITLCMTAWFMSCFIGTLPIETVLRVWDVFFYEGSRTLFRIALTIFKLGESDIKAVQDPMEMFGVVQAFPRRLIDCNVVMEACYRRRNGIGHLSQEVVEEKRQERRAGIRRWRAEQEAAAGETAAPSAATAGLDLAADLDADAHRKGNLFGRRKEKDREQVRADEVM
ncbi:rab-GTPase-TBC domain-containing protein [Immersiella caudata]|uniref:Rab-GTPase-TBC domain-containing protein n=1 Tax=Immersiella caudata TaxID=314043 RepID=A0AA39X596_9PEZI|nr:rab-GTPase-TBC domain-containing protein [Immersiella caudata]